MTKPVFRKAILWMLMADFVTESVFSKASDVSYKHGSFTKIGSDAVCVRVSF